MPDPLSHGRIEETAAGSYSFLCMLPRCQFMVTDCRSLRELRAHAETHAAGHE